MDRFKITSSRGFTLVEVLIALSLTVIMSGILFSAVHTYAQTSSVGREHVRRIQREQAVHQFLQTQIRETLPLAIRTQRGTFRALFNADERKMVFIGNIPSHRSTGGPHKNALYIESTPSGERLMFAYERFVHGDGNDGLLAEFAHALPSNTRLLVPDAASVTFEYFGAPETDDPAGWHDRWNQSNSLPELMRIRIEDKSGRSRQIVTRFYQRKPVIHAALTSPRQRTAPEASPTGGRGPALRAGQSNAMAPALRKTEQNRR